MAKKISVYSTPTCPYCIRLKKFLKDSKVEFEDIDVSADEAKGREMVNKSGQMGVPVTEIDGNIIVGFDKPAIEKALGL